ncbi:MAG: hypothetical protein U1A78_30095 [Polyangia bacterium]
MGWWLLLGLVAVGGIVASLYDRATDSYGSGFRALNLFSAAATGPIPFVPLPQVLGFYAAIGVLVWVIYTFMTSHKRYGVAITSYALARVRGRKVQIFRYTDIASASQRQLGARGKRFTVLTLTEKDGKTYDIYCHGGWAAAARARFPESTAG